MSLTNSEPFVQDIITTMLNAARSPLLLLQRDLTIVQAGHVFYRDFQTTPAAVEGQRLDALAGFCNLPDLRASLEALFSAPTPDGDMDIEGTFPGLGRRALRVNARQLHPTLDLYLLAVEISAPQLALEAEAHPGRAMLLQITEKTPYLIYVYDIRTQSLTYANAYTYNFYQPSDSTHPIRIERLFDALHPDEKHLFDDYFARAMAAADGEIITSEYRMKNVQGEWRWLRGHDTVLSRDEHGQPLEILGTSMDITAQKQAEQAQHESQEFRQRITDTSPYMIYVYDLVEQRNVYANHYIDLVLGSVKGNTSNLVEADIVARIHQDDIPRLRQEVARLQSGGNDSISEVEFRLKTTDGEWRWFRERKVPFKRAPDGSLIQFLGIGTDITDSKHAEAELRQREEQFRLALENMPVLLDAFDQNLLFSVWNAECERVTGYPADEIVGNPHALELLYPNADMRNRMLAEWAALGGNFRDFEYPITCKDGTVKIIAWSNISEQHPVPGWNYWAVGVDITARKQAEQLKLEQEKVLLLEQVIRDTSHDLKTPITTLGTSIYLLNKFTDKLLGLIVELTSAVNQTEEADALVAQIDQTILSIRARSDTLEESISRLHKLVESLFDMAKLDNRSHYQFGFHNLNDVVRALVEDVAPLAQARGIDLLLEPDHRIPLTWMDDVEIRRAIEKLLENALDYTSIGGAVTIKIFAHSGEFIIEVIDNGAGIPADALPYIFDRFFRADQARQPNSGGIGLGLSIAQKIVQVHRGRIEVESVEGSGSRFRIALPTTPDAFQ